MLDVLEWCSKYLSKWNKIFERVLLSDTSPTEYAIRIRIVIAVCRKRKRRTCSCDFQLFVLQMMQKILAVSYNMFNRRRPTESFSRKNWSHSLLCNKNTWIKITHEKCEWDIDLSWRTLRSIHPSNKPPSNTTCNLYNRCDYTWIIEEWWWR